MGISHGFALDLDLIHTRNKNNDTEFSLDNKFARNVCGLFPNSHVEEKVKFPEIIQVYQKTGGSSLVFITWKRT